MSSNLTSVQLRTSEQTKTITYSVTATDNVSISSVSIPGTSQGSQIGATYTFTETFDYDDYSYGNSIVTRTATVDDTYGNSSTQTITLTITKIDNQSPTISLNSDLTSISLNASNPTQVTTYTLAATDNVSISSVSIPFTSQQSQNGATYTFTETFDYDDYSYGNTPITRTATVTDNAGNVTTDSIDLNINKINSPPVFSSLNEFSVLESTNFVGVLSASDPDGDAVTYNVVVTNNISLSLDSATGVLTFEVLPDYEQDPINYICIFSASDENGVSSLTTNIINITDDRTEDTDGDGLTEFQEEDNYGTSDLLADTDGDGLTDDEEILGLLIQPSTNYTVINFDEEISWDDALADAESRGGHLATITSQEENEIMNSQIINQSAGGAWIGLFCGPGGNAHSALFEWVTGELYSIYIEGIGHSPFYENWASDHPRQNSSVGFNGARIYLHSRNNGIWEWGHNDLHYNRYPKNDSYVLETYTLNRQLIGTNPLVTDTDGDGLTDYEEVKTYLTEPLISDSDDEGLADGYEINISYTNPNDSDSDDDGLTDYQEAVTYNTDPLVDADKDGDGLTDYQEVVTYNTDPNNLDSDEDGIYDGDEVSLGVMEISFHPAIHSSNTLSMINSTSTMMPSLIQTSNTVWRANSNEVTISVRVQSFNSLTEVPSTNHIHQTIPMNEDADFIRIHKFKKR